MYVYKKYFFKNRILFGYTFHLTKILLVFEIPRKVIKKLQKIKIKISILFENKLLKMVMKQEVEVYQQEEIENHEILCELFDWPEVNKSQSLKTVKLFSHGKRVTFSF